MSAVDLEIALRRFGIDARVEGRDSLAVLLPRGDVTALADAATRRAAAALAREHGFTHLALELVDAEDGRGGGAAVHRD